MENFTGDTTITRGAGFSELSLYSLSDHLLCDLNDREWISILCDGSHVFLFVMWACIDREGTTPRWLTAREFLRLIDGGRLKRGQSVAPRSIRKTIHHHSSACVPPVPPYDFNGWWNEKWLGGQICWEQMWKLPASKHNQCLLLD